MQLFAFLLPLESLNFLQDVLEAKLRVVCSPSQVSPQVPLKYPVQGPPAVSSC